MLYWFTSNAWVRCHCSLVNAGYEIHNQYTHAWKIDRSLQQHLNSVIVLARDITCADLKV